MVEFAILLPVFLLIALIGLDFGRAFVAWVNLQQSARIAANYVSINPTAWDGTKPKGWAQTRQSMSDLVYKDEATSNCIRNGGNNWLDIEVGTIPSGFSATAKPASVTVSCRFALLTPLISAILPNPLTLTAGSSFPIRSSTVANIVGACHAQFTYTGPTSPSATYQFLDYSSPSASGWSWSFGDGGTSTTQNPTHQYVSAGTFTVSLTVTTVSGSCSKSTTLTVGSGSFPTASFTANPTSGNPPLSVQFNDTSTGNPTSWSWAFGDGGTSTSEFPSHSYAASGTYTATLTVNGGSSASLSISVASSTPAPIANFTYTPTSGTAPLTVQFTDTSANSPTSWAWDFNNDGTVDSTAQGPVTWTYSSATTYTAKLTVTNAGGTSFKTVNITVTTSLCQVPNFVGDTIQKVRGVADTTGFTTTENAKWTAALFSGSVIFSPQLTNKTGSVTSQTKTAGSFQACTSTTITLIGSW
jgi:PKD repeat protein